MVDDDDGDRVAAMQRRHAETDRDRRWALPMRRLEICWTIALVLYRGRSRRRRRAVAETRRGAGQ
jgi:hypothetical protein